MTSTLLSNLYRKQVSDANPLSKRSLPVLNSSASRRRRALSSLLTLFEGNETGSVRACSFWENQQLKNIRVRMHHALLYYYIIILDIITCVFKSMSLHGKPYTMYIFILTCLDVHTYHKHHWYMFSAQQRNARHYVFLCRKWDTPESFRSHFLLS